MTASARPTDKVSSADGIKNVVAVAASAGGLRALRVLLSGLPADFPAPVIVVQHLDPRHPSLLAGILGRATSLRVKQAESGDRLRPGTVYVAPPDFHLLANPDDTLALTHTDPVRFVRPSADRLFESLAASHGTRAIAVVLTGMGSDGADGVRAIKLHGGRVLVQDQATAEFSAMPAAAALTGQADAVLPLPEIAQALVAMTEEGGVAR